MVRQCSDAQIPTGEDNALLLGTLCRQEASNPVSEMSERVDVEVKGFEKVQ
jgi:hypothetical protein